MPGPPDKSELVQVSNFNSPTALQTALDSYGAQGYHGPYATFTMKDANGVEQQYIYVGGYAP